jgi:hypothetical protein
MLYLGQFKTINFWLYFEPRDFWVGAYIKKPEFAAPDLFIHSMFICFLPMIGIKIQWVGK